MTANPEISIERRIPTRKDALIFRGKTALLQMKRAVDDRTGKRVERHKNGSSLSAEQVIATSKTPLWTESEPEERFLLAGKIHNLRLAVRRLDGLEVPAGAVFSFWKHVGRTTRMRGFVVGRELREGCIIPNIGGGLCQLSNALYDAALDANFEIVERHAHTQVIAGSLAEKGRDATVFWNYVDLRFRSEKPFFIEAKLDEKDLIVRFRGEKQTRPALHQIRRIAVHNDTPESCATCEMGDCHRVVDPAPHRDFGKTAYLTDEFSPEFDAYIQNERTNKDVLFVPLDGARFKKQNYGWTTNGFERTRQSLAVTALRSYRSRKLAAQGSARQLNLLATYEKLSESYAAKLGYDTLHVVVQQNLLPYLWRNGHLGGRTFDVLMAALPMNELQKRLDRAYLLHPESTTLGDFRADAALLDAETEALAHARKIITPHTDIAGLFGSRSELLTWELPTTERRARAQNDRPRIVFPAATVGRKGCYELREAVRGLDVVIVLLGSEIEGTEFWKGFDTEKGGDWLAVADLVVLPAHVEHKPRRLLLAASRGIPVIASTACGLGNVDGVDTVEAGDAVSLREKIVLHLAAVRSLGSRPV
jgi:VanW like protein